MRVRYLAPFSVLLVSAAWTFAQQTTQITRCSVGLIEGEVRAGEQFVRPIGSGLEVMLEPLPSGWILRVLPAGTPRPTHDYAELATPPYHSVSPLLISTDFSFRAQDTIGWNPRRFRFASSASSFSKLLSAYDLYEGKRDSDPAAQDALAALVSHAPAGSFTILDSRLIPGTGDQPYAAATLAGRFAETAHTIEAPPDGKPTKLGKIVWMRFRIAFEPGQGFRFDPTLETKVFPCGTMESSLQKAQKR